MFRGLLALWRRVASIPRPYPGDGLASALEQAALASTLSLTAAATSREARSRALALDSSMTATPASSFGVAASTATHGRVTGIEVG